MGTVNYTRPDWIVERRNAAGEFERFPSSYSYKPVDRAAMERWVERLANANPADEFRGHNIAYCRCHATAFKRGTC